MNGSIFETSSAHRNQKKNPLPEDSTGCLSEPPLLQNIKKWDGKKRIHSVYRTRFGYDLASCPECEGEPNLYLTQMVCVLNNKFSGKLMPNFICENCSILILEEDLVYNDALENNLNYQFPVAIFSPDFDTSTSTFDDLLQTYEGRDCTFVSDQNKIQLVPISTMISEMSMELIIDLVPAKKCDKNKKRKRKLQKSSRKRNRKK